MQYLSKYNSPLGEILIASDEDSIIGIWFADQKYYATKINKDCKEKETKIILETKKWLDIYFKGIEPDLKVSINFIGSDFQKEVWNILCTIPYGKTITYGDIAKILEKEKGIKKISAQAVGGAVGRNPISIIVPCHRVMGKNGNLTGYAGGIDKKIKLLQIENAYHENFFEPKNK